MHVGIDAHNISAGGGVTHLVELLRTASPRELGFDQVTIWGGASTLSRVDERPWLRKVHEPLLDRALPMRVYWQRFVLDRRVRAARCNILFVPGGSYRGTFRPFVTMSRNMLPFDAKEIGRYGRSLATLRLRILKHTQEKTFNRADGVIFLSKYARDTVIKTLSQDPRETVIIPHGVSSWFASVPREQKPISSFSFRNPFRCLYVSTVTVYKHQWNVAEAVWVLRNQGYPIILDLIGPTTQKGRKLLQRTIERVDPKGEFIYNHGPVAHIHLSKRYRESELFVFASSCENMPIILLEAMASGLPIACSNRGPMAEILGEYGVYFDPENPREIADAIKCLIDDPKLRAVKAGGGYEHAQALTWNRCAHDTFTFLAQVAKCT